MNFTQDFFTSRNNNLDGTTHIGQQDRLWYEPTTNTIRIGNGTPGGLIVGQGGSAEGDPIFLASPAAGIDVTDISNWDEAYNSSINLAGGSSNQVLVKQSGAGGDYQWEDMIIQETVYTKLIDDTSTVDVMYLGEAVPDSLESAAVWRLQKIVFDAFGNVDSVRYAASGEFTQSWNDRLSVIYA